MLAEIGAARTGAMREIVATIQAEQDDVIRAPLEQRSSSRAAPARARPRSACTAPRTCCSSTAAGWSRDGVLVVGPNEVFLDYIGNVLPSLGERSVRQCTALDLCVPKVEITGTDDDGVRRDKGDATMLDLLADATTAHVIDPPRTCASRWGRARSSSRATRWPRGSARRSTAAAR